MLVEIQSNLYYPIHPQHPPRSSDKNQQHLSDSNLYMTMNLSIDEFNHKNIHVKKTQIDEKNWFFFYWKKKNIHTIPISGLRVVT